MNGKLGDHPITDILKYEIKVYRPLADGMIRKIAALCSRRELDEWWEREIGWSADTDSVLQKAEARHNELMEQASDSGWELPKDAE